MRTASSIPESKIHKRRELHNISEEHRCKIPQQNSGQYNPSSSEDHSPGPSGIYP